MPIGFSTAIHIIQAFGSSRSIPLLPSIRSALAPAIELLGCEKTTRSTGSGSAVMKTTTASCQVEKRRADIPIRRRAVFARGRERPAGWANPKSAI